MAKETETEKAGVGEEAAARHEEDKAIETTAQEMEGFMIVKSIIRKKIDANRIVARDTKTYYGILLDDNNRKPLCRLWFNGTKKYLGLFDETKNETRHELQKLDDIFNYTEQLLKSVDLYEKEEKVTNATI